MINAQDIKAANAKDANVDCNGDGNTTNNQGKGKGQGNVHGKDVSCIATLIGNNPNNPHVQAAQTGGSNIELYFAYNEQGQLLGEYDTNTQPEQEMVYLNGIPIATLQHGVVYTVHTDHLNTPRVITDAANTVVWRWEGEPFGHTEADEDPDGDGNNITFNHRFAGQYYDAETALHYNYFRYYDPSTGRYVTSDPIGLKGGNNTYGYVSGNPLRFRDPNGLIGLNDAQFVWHYYTGFGQPFVVSGELLNTFRNSPSVSQGVSNFEGQIDTAAQAAAIGSCLNSRCDDEDKFFQFSTSSSQHRDVTDQIFSLGDGILNSRANCRGTVNCKYGTFSFRCSNTYRSNDEFRDPLDFHERFGIELEPGGTPYDIIIIWPGSYSGSGSF